MKPVCSVDQKHKIAVVLFGKAFVGKRGGGVVHIICADCRKELLTVDARSSYSRKNKPLKKLKISDGYDFDSSGVQLHLTPINESE